MKKLFVVLVAGSLAYAAQSQSMGRSYRTALGVKVWDGAGITLKHFISNKHALEGIAYFWGAWRKDNRPLRNTRKH